MMMEKWQKHPIRLFTCDLQSVDPKDGRIIGVDLLDLDQGNDFNLNQDLAIGLAIEFIALHVTWSSLEASPNVYSDPDDAIMALGQVAQTNNWKFSLTIRPIDLTGKNRAFLSVYHSFQ